ncbi:MAG: 50S ribosomal protein L10 [Proteobacteria bacterium]|nr:50S ribosomal protein L10 [Pseudomonadota bacterium]
MKIDGKKAIVEELSEVAARSGSLFAAHYRGLKVSELTKLRTNARKVKASVKVYRNTLARKALAGTHFQSIQDSLVGPTILVFTKDEPAATARLLRDFAKDHNNFVVQALVLEGRLMAADQIKAVASMPSREEALAQLMSVMKAPVVQLARTMTETYGQFVRVLSAVADKKGAAVL